MRKYQYDLVESALVPINARTIFPSCFARTAANIQYIADSCLSLYRQGVCVMITGFLHFFFLASFCWVLTEAWQSYMAVTGKVRTRLIRKRFLCLGWGKKAACFPKPLHYLPSSIAAAVSSQGLWPRCLSKYLCVFFSVRCSHPLSVGQPDLPPVGLFVVMLLCSSQALWGPGKWTGPQDRPVRLQQSRLKECVSGEHTVCTVKPQKRRRKERGEREEMLAKVKWSDLSWLYIFWNPFQFNYL